MDLVKRFLSNLLPLTLLALAVTVLLFMSNDGCRRIDWILQA